MVPLCTPNLFMVGRCVGRKRAFVLRRILLSAALIVAILLHLALIVKLRKEIHFADLYYTSDVITRIPFATFASTRCKRIFIPGTKAVIAYAISITSCPALNDTSTHSVFDGPAVLGYSIYRSSIRSNATESKYDFELFAFVHPDAQECAENLSKIGYNVLIRPTAVDVNRIKNKQYKIDIEAKGCCGSKEFMKLWAYTLVDYPIVVHLDTDCFLNKPFDELFDAMLTGNASELTLPTMFNKPLPPKIDFFFTRDYHQRSKITTDPSKYGVQGGFFVARPDLHLFQELRDSIERGNYTAEGGWTGNLYGGYWGSSQIQGFLSYFYGSVRSFSAVELNRCIFNSMTDDDPIFDGKCRTGEIKCEDCRLTPLSEVVSFHMTTCWKPWQCPKISKPHPVTCNDVHLAWFKLRQSLEIEWGIDVPKDGWWFKRTLGYCKRPEGAKRRIYIPLQYGPQVSALMK